MLIVLEWFAPDLPGVFKLTKRLKVFKLTKGWNQQFLKECQQFLCLRNKMHLSKEVRSIKKIELYGLQTISYIAPKL